MYIADMNNKEIKDVAESNQLNIVTEFDRIMEIIQGEGGWYGLQIAKIPETEEDDDEYIKQYGECVKGSEYLLEAIREAEWIYD